MLKVEITGVEALQRKLGDMLAMKAVKQVVRKNGMELQNRMQRKAIFTRGYSTGQTKRSIPISSGFMDDGMTAFVQPGTDYAPYVEYGTRKMSAHSFVRPAFNEQKEQFIADMQKLVGK